MNTNAFRLLLFTVAMYLSAWTFNVPYVTFSNGSKWKVQGEWSNNAYNSGTGYPNRSGQKGCLDGH